MAYDKNFILPPQLHLKVRDEHLEKEHFKKVENSEYSYYLSLCSPYELHRPRFGFWTSTYDEEFGSDWFQWNIHREFNGTFPSDYLMRSVILTPSESAKVYVLDSYEDLDRLMYRFRLSLPTNKRKKVPFLDFERISRYYDALHLTKNGLSTLENTDPYSLKYWDCESTLWFNFDHFSSIESLGQKVYKRDELYQKTPDLAGVK